MFVITVGVTIATASAAAAQESARTSLGVWAVVQPSCAIHVSTAASGLPSVRLQGTSADVAHARVTVTGESLVQIDF